MEIPLLFNDYLQEESVKIRNRIVPWEGYQKANLITEEELELIRSSDRKGNSSLLYATLLGKLSRIDTIQSILLMVSDYIGKTENNGGMSLHLDLFLNLLSNSDEYIRLQSCFISVRIVLAIHCDYPSKLFSFLLELISSDNNVHIDIGLQFLLSLLSVPLYRIKFDGMKQVLHIASNTKSSQFQYQSIYIIWLLSFTPSIEHLEHEFHFLASLKDVLQVSIKEKVVRVIVGTFRNMSGIQDCIITMLALKIHIVLEVMATRKWSDVEIVDDLNFLRDVLLKHLAHLSSWDEYKTELERFRRTYKVLVYTGPHLILQISFGNNIMKY